MRLADMRLAEWLKSHVTRSQVVSLLSLLFEALTLAAAYAHRLNAEQAASISAGLGLLIACCRSLLYELGATAPDAQAVTPEATFKALTDTIHALSLSKTDPNRTTVIAAQPPAPAGVMPGLTPSLAAVGVGMDGTTHVTVPGAVALDATGGAWVRAAALAQIANVSVSVTGRGLELRETPLASASDLLTSATTPAIGGTP